MWARQPTQRLSRSHHYKAWHLSSHHITSHHNNATSPKSHHVCVCVTVATHHITHHHITSHSHHVSFMDGATNLLKSCRKAITPWDVHLSAHHITFIFTSHVPPRMLWARQTTHSCRKAITNMTWHLSSHHITSYPQHHNTFRCSHHVYLI